MGDDKRRPYANNSATRPGRGDPRGRPSRIQHGFPYFVRGRRPPPSWRPVPTQTRPSGNRHPAWATTSVAPTRTTRRRGPRRGDPRGRPSRIQHGFPYFVRGRRPPPSWRPVPTQTRPSGNRHPAWATTSVAPTRTTRRRGPRRGDPRGRPSRIQHGFPYFVRGRRPPPSWRPVPTQTRPSGNRHPAWATTSVAPTRTTRRRGPVGATLAVAHLESNTASFTSYVVVSSFRTSPPTRADSPPSLPLD